MPHKIIEALGLQSLPASEQEAIIKKVLADNFVRLRTNEVMLEHFAAEAIGRMHSLEFSALHKRVNPPPPVQPLHFVQWAVEPGLSGKPFLRGLCGRCAQDCRFDGKPEAAKKIVWAHCTLGPSKPPEEALAEYARRFGYLMV